MNATGTFTEQPERPPRRGLVGPAILVALGVVLLLNNMGYLGWGIWGTLTLPQQGQVRARINGGVGQTVVIIPAGMAARIEATAGLGQVNVIGSYQREGKISISPGYDSAANRVDLVVNGGVGGITVRQASGR